MSWKLSITCCVLLAAVRDVGAVEIDPRLPADAEVVVSLNIEQLLASPLGKRYLRTTLEEAIKGNGQVQELLKHLELEPLRDIGRATLALPSAGSDNAFVIFKGKFNRKKIAEIAEKVAADQKDKFKIHRAGAVIVYEIVGDKSIFASLPDDSTLLLANNKEQLTVTSKSGAKKELAALIRKVDGKHAGWLAMLPAATAAIPGAGEDHRQVFEKLDGITGVLKVTTSARLELSLQAPDAATAAGVARIISDLVATANAFGREAVKEKPELAPLFELIASVRASAPGSGKVVNVVAELNAAQIEKAIKQVVGDK